MVTVVVQEERAGEWSVVSSSVPAEKVSSTVTRFRVRVPAPGGGSADVSNSRDLVTPNQAVTIVHLSDLHFGEFADLKQIEALETFLPSLGATATRRLW